MKLTIGIVTMNRAQQLKEALNSCLACILPAKTEFVIVDNASTDSTEAIAREILEKSPYKYKYYKMKENIGAGAGRNVYFKKAEGKYIYGCDDDAIIDYKKNPDFFLRAIKIMDNNPKIATLATQIYDRAWKANRQHISGPKITEGIYKCKMFCGGSHFLRKDFFSRPPYLHNKYGYVELPPSLMTMDQGRLNVFCPELLVIHNPKVNKWDYSNADNQKLLITECAVPYAIKKMMYPIITRPVIYLLYKQRCRKYLKNDKMRNETKYMIQETILNCNINYRMKIRTIIEMYHDFGICIF